MLRHLFMKRLNDEEGKKIVRLFLWRGFVMFLTMHYCHKRLRDFFVKRVTKKKKKITEFFFFISVRDVSH